MFSIQTSYAIAIPLYLTLNTPMWAKPSEPTSALAYQQTTNTRIVVEENHLRFYTGGKERMTIDANGFLGFGTTSPESFFHIQKSKTGIASSSGDLIVEDEDAHIDIVSSSADRWGSSINLVEGDGVTNTDIWSISRQTTGGTGNSSLRINFGSDNNQATNTNKFTITADGKVGVGTTNPTSELELKSVANENSELHINTASDGGISILRFQDAGSSTWGFLSNYPTDGKFSLHNYGLNANVLSADNNGNVGIGTTDPGSYKLNVNGSIYTNGNITFPTVAHNGTSYATHMSFPVLSDGFFIITEQKAADKMNVLFRFRDNTTGDYFKMWFDDHRGEAYDTYPLIVYGEGIHLVSDKGNVGVGTTSPVHKLHVVGNTHSSTYSADSPPTWPDYVFEDTYDLQSLEQVEKYIDKNHHLPEIPNAEEVKANGVDIVQMQSKLLQKIEELTLYVIEQNKKMEEQQREIENLKAKIN